jgi:hypothetical protein
MQIKKSDLTPAQLSLLTRLASGVPQISIDEQTYHELKELGLAEQKLGGPGASSEGKALLRNSLLLRPR